MRLGLAPNPPYVAMRLYVSRPDGSWVQEFVSLSIARFSFSLATLAG